MREKFLWKGLHLKIFLMKMMKIEEFVEKKGKLKVNKNFYIDGAQYEDNHSHSK